LRTPGTLLRTIAEGLLGFRLAELLDEQRD
jgi:hypothetical protein